MEDVAKQGRPLDPIINQTNKEYDEKHDAAKKTRQEQTQEAQKKRKQNKNKKR